jgi:hypothetical protein
MAAMRKAMSRPIVGRRVRGHPDSSVAQHRPPNDRPEGNQAWRDQQAKPNRATGHVGIALIESSRVGVGGRG